MVSFSKFSSKNETEELWILRSKRPDSLLDLVQWPFDRLMTDLVSNSNTDRAHAEEFLQYLSKNHPALLCLKTSLLLCSPHSEKRFVSAILLRQFFTPSSAFYVWPLLSPICQFYLRKTLLLALEEEKIRYIANAKSDTIAELASILVPLDQPQYPELLRFVLARIAKREPPVLVEASLHIFAQIVKPLAHMMVLKVPTLRSILSMCINHPTSSDVRVAALPALCCLVQSLPSSVDHNELRNLLILLNNGLVKALAEIEITLLLKVLEMLINLAGDEPNFFCNFIGSTDIVLHILAVAENSQVDEGARHLALEFITTLAEAREPATAAAVMCKTPSIGNRVLAILLEMLLDAHNDMAWCSAQLESTETNQSLALECLNRLVFALGGESVLMCAEDTLQTYVISSDCKKRHAALVALALITQGCSTTIDFGGVFHDKVLKSLFETTNDFDNLCMQQEKQTVQEGPHSTPTVIQSALPRVGSPPPPSPGHTVTIVERYRRYRVFHVHDPLYSSHVYYVFDPSAPHDHVAEPYMIHDPHRPSFIPPQYLVYTSDLPLGTHDTHICYVRLSGDFHTVLTPYGYARPFSVRSQDRADGLIMMVYAPHRDHFHIQIRRGYLYRLVLILAALSLFGIALGFTWRIIGRGMYPSSFVAGIYVILAIGSFLFAFFPVWFVFRVTGSDADELPVWGYSAAASFIISIYGFIAYFTS